MSLLEGESSSDETDESGGGGDDLNEQKSLAYLPYDILFMIFSSLNIRDLCSVEIVNDYFSEIVQNVRFSLF
jgi:hypothetical protein